MEAEEDFKLFGVVALTYAIKDLHNFFEIDQVVVVAIHQPEQPFAQHHPRLLPLAPWRYGPELKMSKKSKKIKMFVY